MYASGVAHYPKVHRCTKTECSCSRPLTKLYMAISFKFRRIPSARALKSSTTQVQNMYLSSATLKVVSAMGGTESERIALGTNYLAAMLSPLKKAIWVLLQASTILTRSYSSLRVAFTPSPKLHTNKILLKCNLSEYHSTIPMQVQKLKVDTEAAMLQLDQILRANELSIALVAAIPAFIVAGFSAFFVFRWLMPSPPDARFEALPCRPVLPSFHEMQWTHIRKALQEHVTPLYIMHDGVSLQQVVHTAGNESPSALIWMIVLRLWDSFPHFPFFAKGKSH